MSDTAGRNQPVMPPGRELDSLVAEKVMGWTRMNEEAALPPKRWMWWHEDNELVYRFRRNFEPMQPFGLAPDGGGREVPPFSTEWDAMRLVVERLVALGWAVAIDIDKDGANCVMVCDVEPFNEPRDEIVFTERGDTAPHAVALAARKAVEADHA